MSRTVRTSPRKQAVQARSQATVDALLRATARILIRDGYDGASTNKIASTAGVSVGSLYQYFPSKEALVAALDQRHAKQMIGVLQGTLEELADAPLHDAIRKTVQLMIAAHAMEPKLHKVLMEQVPRSGKASEVRKMEREMGRFVRSYLERKRAELVVDNLDLAAFVVVHIVESLTHTAVLTQPELLTPAFEAEVCAAVQRYLTGKSS